MYPVPDFKAKSDDEVFEFMRMHPFVTLVGNGANGLVATHVPVMLKRLGGKTILEGHMMRKTDHQLAFQQSPNVLAIFDGPHCYVSSSWYTDMSASTWNYMTVHARGEMTFLDESELRRVLQETTDHFEQNSDSPLTFDQLPNDYVNRLIPAIVAFQIEVTSLEHVFKLSQNRDAESYRNIVEQLKKRGREDALVAEEMEKRKPPLTS